MIVLGPFVDHVECARHNIIIYVASHGHHSGIIPAFVDISVASIILNSVPSDMFKKTNRGD